MEDQLHKIIWNRLSPEEQDPVVQRSSNVNLEDLFEKAYTMAISESTSFGQNIQTYQGFDLFVFALLNIQPIKLCALI